MCLTFEVCSLAFCELQIQKPGAKLLGTSFARQLLPLAGFTAGTYWFAIEVTHHNSYRRRSLFRTCLPTYKLKLLPLWLGFYTCGCVFILCWAGMAERLGCWLDDREFTVSEFSLVSIASRHSLGLTRLPMQWIPGGSSPGVKQPGNEADHAPQSSSTSTPQYACIIKYRNNLYRCALCALSYSLSHWYSAFFVGVPSDVISHHLCTPKVVGL
jgi:hypothetical protein